MIAWALLAAWAVGVPAMAFIGWRLDPPQDRHDRHAIAFCALIWPFVLLLLVGDLLTYDTDTAAPGALLIGLLALLAVVLTATAGGVR